MPRIVQTPETPQPVPTSTTFLACSSDATKRNVAPPPGLIGTAGTSVARFLALLRTSSSATNSSAYVSDVGFSPVAMAVS
jgi:hypothetical protein